MKKYIITAFTLLFLVVYSPVQAAFKWPWQVKTEPVKIIADTTTKASINQEALKAGMAKTRTWENLVEAKPARLNQKMQFDLTESELLAILQDAASKLKNGTIDPSSISLKISDGKLIITTRVLKPTSFNLELEIGIQLKNGVLEPQILRAKAGIIRISGHVIEKLAKEIFGEKWKEELNRPAFIWDSVVIKDGKVAISGHTPAKRVQGVQKKR